MKLDERAKARIRERRKQLAKLATKRETALRQSKQFTAQDFLARIY